MVRKALSVAEKPSVAKELAAILSNGTASSNNGVSRFNRVFEFKCTLDGGPCQMSMTSVLGHLMEMDFEEQYRKWHSCAPADLFDAPVRMATREDNGCVDVRRNLEHAVRGCTELILWLDCDREGEAIGFEVMDACLAVVPRLRVRRARFSALIPRDIHYALANLVQPDSNQSEAVLARSEIDLRLGAAFTRLQTTALQNKFEGLDSLLSYGPCQFPTMWFVAQRADRIDAFTPEQFWQIQLAHERIAEDGEALTVQFSWARNRLFDRLATIVLYEMCVNRGTASITGVTAKPTTKRRPCPLATVEFQRLASSRLHISSDISMEIAEKLYQEGYLSYPRTETDTFKQGFDLQNLIRAQLADSRWSAYAQRLLDGDFQWPTPGGKDDNAHPPIHPCKPGANLQGDQAKIYELVTRRFLACCSQDARGHETGARREVWREESCARPRDVPALVGDAHGCACKRLQPCRLTLCTPSPTRFSTARPSSVVRAEMAGEEFSATGLMVIERNYLEIYTFDRWIARKIPTFYVGEHFEPTRLQMSEGSTSPPSYLSESDLIHLMETHGIGTDATSTRCDSPGYLGSPGRSLSVGSAGRGSVGRGGPRL